MSNYHDNEDCNSPDIFDDDELPLVDPGGCGSDEIVYDEDGVFGGVPAGDSPRAVEISPTLPLQPIQLTRPCSLGTLNGSWLLEIAGSSVFLLPTRGPMRIEAQGGVLRVSGDVYARRLTFTTPIAVGPVTIGSPSLVIRRNWYPAYPQKEYAWYFRSRGVSYSKGTLLFKFERHLWSQSQQRFVSTDNGWMRFSCETSIIRPIGWPQPTVKMSGTAMIGGRQYNVTATKTSPYYRGCLVEVDVMTNRQWPSSAPDCGGGPTTTFTGVYRAAGMDFRAVLNELNVPEDSSLTTPELHNLLATHRSLSAGGENWRLWLLVGSSMGSTFGLMFDTGNPPHREGAVGFFDPRLSSLSVIQAAARNKKLGEVPKAFLRTLIHEAGHAFNLFHPKHDVHGVATGTSIMNQTGDVIGFATTTNPYPCNATMAFNEHNRTSLIHSPDPQVKPGWKEFGWGHGSAWSGIGAPADAAGLDDAADDDSSLQLSLDVPPRVHRGEVVLANVKVTNTGTEAHELTTALNLAEGDLKIQVARPDGSTIDARDVIVVCSDRTTKPLPPGSSRHGTVQLHYTPHGLTFDQPGRYELSGELQTGDARGTIIRSKPVSVIVRPATTKKECQCEELTMDAGVGLSLAMGDFGCDEQAHQKLRSAMEAFPDSDTGAACALVVANSLHRDLRDVRANKVVRPSDTSAAEDAMDTALKGRSPDRMVQLAAAVAAARDNDAPILGHVQNLLEKPKKGAYGRQELALAQELLADHLA